MVVRTAWLYGDHGPSFVKTMLRLAKERETISVVDDQTGQPTWTRDLCEFIVALINTEVPGGFYHGTNEGEVTRYDLARAIFALADLDPERVNPCTTTDFPLQAPRPAYSVLDHAAGVPAMPTWHDALQRYLSIP